MSLTSLRKDIDKLDPKFVKKLFVIIIKKIKGELK